MISSFATGQIIGSIAVVISLSVFQVNNRKRMLQRSAAAAVLYAASFYLLNAYTGAILNLIGAIRCLAFTRTITALQSAKTFWLFALVSTIAAALTWVGPLSLLALAGTLCSGLAWGQLRTTNIRRVAVIAPLLWFAYNYVTRSYPGMFNEVFVLVSIFVGQYRFDYKKTIKLT